MDSLNHGHLNVIESRKPLLLAKFVAYLGTSYKNMTIDKYTKYNACFKLLHIQPVQYEAYVLV